MLTGLIGVVLLLASSGVYAGDEAYLDSSPSLAANEGQASGPFQYSEVFYPEDELDKTMPGGTWVDHHVKLRYENEAAEETAVDDSLDSGNTPGTDIGMGVTPLFDTYGVIRASNSHDKSTYIALGFISDELTMDEADISDSGGKSAFSYGFGLNSSSSNFEYMMSVDQENNGVSAVGIRFTSAF
jgi:hypothetical protein